MFGWGAVTHEDLGSRITGSAVWFETFAPTGSFREGTGAGSWVLAPGAGVALNPTDRFPIYVTGTYRHSVGAPSGSVDNREPVTPSAEKIRTLQLDVQTAHIFPKGFFMAALPGFNFDFTQGSNTFFLGIGVGRALNRRFAMDGGYFHHLAGTKLFKRSVFIRLSFLIGEAKKKETVH